MKVKAVNWKLIASTDASTRFIAGEYPYILLFGISDNNIKVSIIFRYEYVFSVTRAASIMINKWYPGLDTEEYMVNNSVDRLLSPNTTLIKYYVPKSRVYKDIIEKCKQNDFVIYNAINRDISGFFIETGIKPSDSIYIPDEDIRISHLFTMDLTIGDNDRCFKPTKMHEYFVDVKFRDISKSVRGIDQIMPLYSVFTYDLEVLITRADRMPNPIDPEACILSISVEFTDSNGNSSVYLLCLNYKHILTKRLNIREHREKVDLNCNATTLVYETEELLILDFLRLIQCLRPDVISGFNLKFDLGYLYSRCEFMSIKHELDKICYLKNCTVYTNEKENELKNTTEFTCDIPGIIIFDMYIHSTEVEKYREYTLDNVIIQGLSLETAAPCISNDRIATFHYKSNNSVVNTAFKETTWIIIYDEQNGCIQTEFGIKAKTIRDQCQHHPDTASISVLIPSKLNLYGRCVIAPCKDAIDLFELCDGLMHNVDTMCDAYIDMLVYNIQDSKLSKYLYDKYCIDSLIQASSDLTMLPQSAIQRYKNTTKTLAVMQTTAYKIGVATTNLAKSVYKPPKYRGGIVYEIQEKIFDDPVGVIDFEGLYPSIAKSFNLSPDTLVKEYTYKSPLEFPDIRKYKDDSKYVIIYTRDADDVPMPSFYILVFERRVALIPSVLRYTTELRKKYKNEVKMFPSGSKEQGYAESMQYLLKIYSNSIYGLLAAVFYSLYCYSVAKSIAALARWANEDLLLFINERPYIRSESNHWVMCNDPSSSIVHLSCIYGDTDSQFIKFKFVDGCFSLDMIESVFEMGYSIENEYRKSRKFGLNVEFEKILISLIMFSKKQYSAIGYTSPTKTKNIEQGTTFVRRDRFELQKYIYKLSIQAVRTYSLVHKNKDQLESEICSIVRDVVDKEFVPNNKLNKFLKYSSYSGNYSPTHQLYNAINNYNAIVGSSNALVKGSRFKYALITNEVDAYNAKYTSGVSRFTRIIGDNSDCIPENRLVLEYYLSSCKKVFEKFFFDEAKSEALYEEMSKLVESRIS